jgi:hypothetical protein
LLREGWQIRAAAARIDDERTCIRLKTAPANEPQVFLTALASIA